MRVSVSGANGFIGRHVVRALLARGADVTALSRDPSKLADLPIRTLTIDVLTARPQSTGQIGDPDVLLHLAWSGLPNYRARHHLDQWTGHATFLDACLDAGLERLLVTGTCLEYGSQSGELSESLPALPNIAYAQGKHALHEHLLARKQERPFSLGWLRLFYLFGPGQAAGSLYPLLNAAVARGDHSFDMSPGDQIRDFLAVEQAADHIASLALGNAPVDTVNICSGRPMSVAETASSWLEELGSTMTLNLGVLPYPDYEPFAFWGSSRRLRTLLEQS